MPPSIDVDCSDRAVTAYIGIGSNLGDRATNVRSAVDALAGLPVTRLVARSSLYATAPVDAGGYDYLNAVVCISTRLEPEALLQALQVIEAQHGRTRPFVHAPRTLDLDLLTYGDSRIDGDRLVVPHPRLAQRAFVLMPLAEIAPSLVVAGIGSVAALLPAVAAQRVTRLAGSCGWYSRPSQCSS